MEGEDPLHFYVANLSAGDKPQPYRGGWSPSANLRIRQGRGRSQAPVVQQGIPIDLVLRQAVIRPFFPPPYSHCETFCHIGLRGGVSWIGKRSWQSAFWFDDDKQAGSLRQKADCHAACGSSQRQNIKLVSLPTFSWTSPSPPLYGHPQSAELCLNTNEVGFMNIPD